MISQFVDVTNNRSISTKEKKCRNPSPSNNNNNKNKDTRLKRLYGIII